MPGELHDLDAWLEEEERQAPQVKLFGEQATLPAEPPFDLILRVYRLLEGRGEKAELDPEAMAEVLGLIYGPERVAEWRRRGLGVRRMEKLARIAMDFWQLSGDVDKAEDAKGPSGEQPAPEGSGPSSPTGPSSSPTSNGSTSSTSIESGDGSAGDGSGGSSPASLPTPGSPWPSPATTSG